MSDNQKLEAPPEGLYKSLKMRQERENEGAQLQKKKILGLIGLCALVLFFAFTQSLESSNAKQAEQGNEPVYNGSSPTAPVRELPNSYAELPKVEPPVPQQLIIEGKSKPDYSEFLKELLEKERQRKERLQAARESSITFSSSSDTQRGSSSFPSLSYPKDSPQPQLSSGSLNERDAANRQDEKTSFLERESTDDVYLDSRRLALRSDYEVQAGTVIPGVLISGINSDLPGPISGQVSQNVFDSPTGNHLLIPQGTRVLGKYDSRVTFGQKRVLVAWDRLIFPDGSSISLKGMPGVDLSGYSGLQDEVDRHFDDILLGTLIGATLGASAQVAEGNTSLTEPTFGQLALSGASRQINQTGQQFVSQMLQVQPTLKVAPGFRFNIFVTKDFQLKPYDKKQ